MPKTIATAVKNLSLDLSNFRTVPQRNEIQAIQVMIALKADRFWALVESLVDDGYLPTENILVIRANDGKLTVKEGNRRVAALKFLHGYISDKTIIPPNDELKQKIATLSSSWKKANEKIACAIYESKDADKVDRIVELAHGKGEKAGRDQWNAVARARHHRDHGGVSEPGLDLLEKYLKHGKNVTKLEKERWAGEYPLTILQEAISRITNRLGLKNAVDLVKKYPEISNRAGLERLINEIGNKNVTFKTIRNTEKDFGVLFGFPPIIETASTASTPATTSTQPSITPNDPPKSPVQVSPPSSTPAEPPATLSKVKKLALAINDPRTVKLALKKFEIYGEQRDKVVSLRNEAVELNLNKNPIAFCFLLRSMFEISAKAYCDDHASQNGPQYKKADGNERRLVDILRDIHTHLTNNNQDRDMIKALHGAMVELGKPEGILSVTSMNQLVHNPTFSLTAGDISSMFGNIFPLLVAMNQ